MRRAGRLPAIVVLLFGLGLILTTQAHAFELTGAWSTDDKMCNQVFTKKGKQVVFTEFSELYGSGLLIAGNRIRARSAQCTIKSRKQEGNVVQISAACSTSIMSDSLRLAFKIIDDNNFSRILPGTEGTELRYTRCVL